MEPMTLRDVAEKHPSFLRTLSFINLGAGI